MVEKKKEKKEKSEMADPAVASGGSLNAGGVRESS